ncbi:glycosyltransferase [Lachnospiraceae bacterium ZAX-1]
MDELKKNIIIFKANFDSLISFAEQMTDAFLKMGYDVLLVDMENSVKTLAAIYEFAVPNQTVALFFNHVGLNLLNKEHGILWNELKTDCYDMIVDHPMYYHAAIIFPIEKSTFLCVDKFHQKFIERFYKERVKSYFLPLAGSKATQPEIAFRERSMDIVFTGAYLVDNRIDIHTAGLLEGTKALWMECYQLLTTCKTMAIEQAVESCLTKKGIQLPEEDLRDTVRLFKEMDGMLRSTMRAKVVKILADNDIQCHVYGEGWEFLDCKQENLIIHGRVAFLESIRLMADARIVLNVMPWFKDGVHDRVYTAMLNKSVCLTDSSKFMDETLKDGEHVIMYSLDALEELPKKVRYYLDHIDVLEKISQTGYQYADGNEDWTSRAKLLESIFKGRE